MPLTLRERHDLAALANPLMIGLQATIERLSKVHHKKTSADLWETDRWHEVVERGHAAISADPEIQALKVAYEHAEMARRSVMTSDGG